MEAFVAEGFVPNPRLQDNRGLQSSCALLFDSIQDTFQALGRKSDGNTTFALSRHPNADSTAQYIFHFLSGRFKIGRLVYWSGSFVFGIFDQMLRFPNREFLTDNFFVKLQLLFLAPTLMSARPCPYLNHRASLFGSPDLTSTDEYNGDVDRFFPTRSLN